jgi:copper chaperone CopZ
MAGRGHGTRAGTGHEMPAGQVAMVVLHVGGLGWASEKAVVERVLGRRAGVRAVEASPVSLTATVTFDTAQASVAGLRRWVEECGYHCAGLSVPLMSATRWRSLTRRAGITPCPAGTAGRQERDGAGNLGPDPGGGDGQDRDADQGRA